MTWWLTVIICVASWLTFGWLLGALNCYWEGRKKTGGSEVDAFDIGMSMIFWPILLAAMVAEAHSGLAKKLNERGRTYHDRKEAKELKDQVAKDLKELGIKRKVL